MVSKRVWGFLLGCIVAGSLVVSVICTDRTQKQQSFVGGVESLMADLGFACHGLSDCVAVTQKEFLRPVGKELWHIKDPKMTLQDVVMPHMHALGFVEARFPQYKEYTYAVIIGATLPSVRLRLSLLKEYWDQGIRFNEIVLLGGERPLDQQKELDILLAEGMAPAVLPTTEAEMLQYVFASTQLPDEMRKVRVTLVNAHGYTGTDGVYKRPSMIDTLQEWLRKNPAPGSVLAVAHQPFCLYSHIIFKTTLPTSFTIETVGSKAGPAVTVAVYLDTLTRVLYQTHNAGYAAVDELL